MKNNVTEIVFILDKSGSMHGLEKDTVGGFNSMIEKQKANDAPCFITTLLFNDKIEFLHDRKPLSEVKPITENEYSVGGCTALLDAIGSGIEHISSIHKYARKEDVPEKTLFVITTDGMENASHSYNINKIKQLIEAKQALGWEFLFIGANIDAIGTADDFGIPPTRAVNYHADEEGTDVLYSAVSDAICFMRKESKMSDKWNEKIKKDYSKRKK